MTIKINSLEIENVKRVKAVSLQPSANGLTVIGGKNAQGKTSVLDAIAWALGGDKNRPSQAKSTNSVLPPHIHVELSNGIVVERTGKNSALKVFDPSGRKGGQQLLNEFVESLALDLPKFMNLNSKDKARTLLDIVGIGPELAKLEMDEQAVYNQRLEVGRIADKKKAYADTLESYPDAPSEPVSASELIRQQQEILAKNGENQRKRESLADLQRRDADLQAAIKRLKEQYDTCMAEHQDMLVSIATASKSVAELQDESTAELEASIANIDAINVKVRANQEKIRATQEAEDVSGQYADLEAKIIDVRKAKLSLLEGANLPLSGLTVTDGELSYNGQAWDCMSSSEQLKVATAIVRRLNPQCGFVLMDKLEQMDVETMQEFGAWLEAEGLQVIATRVSTGGECSLIIEDGTVKEEMEVPEPVPVITKKWGDEF
jgi:hypothetical protein